jgi:hypothetical protein
MIARPHSHVLVAEPERYPGKVVYDKLVFPRYGKRDGALHPGPQEVDAALWAALEGQLAEFRRRQKARRQGR